MKEMVLEALQSSPGFVSGEGISRQVGKSRTAVWQWIRALRDDGYEIEAAPRKGYRLLSRPDRLYPWEVVPKMEAQLFGRPLEYRSSVGSTNDVAKTLAKEGAPEGLVVVAEEQRAGRGRRGRSWASPFALGIWASTVLRPDISPFDAPKMALVAALATVRAVEKVTDLEAMVKWPNDVLVGGKKVAGILVEMDAEIGCVRYLVVGTGINANLPLESIPEEARPRATSLMVAGGRKVDRAALLGRLLTELEILYLQWQKQGFNRVLKAVRQRTACLGRPVRVLEQGKAWDGEALDLAPDGALLVRNQAGRVIPVYAAEVSIREGERREGAGTREMST